MLQKLINWIKSFRKDPKKSPEIPSTLWGAAYWIKQHMPEAEKEDIKAGKLSTSLGHHNIGRWMRNNWGLWKKEGPLHDYFTKLGIMHPDDMTGLILEALEADLRQEPFRVNKRITHYRNYWRKQGVNPDTLQETEEEDILELR